MQPCSSTYYFGIDIVGVNLLDEKQSKDDNESQCRATVEEGNQKSGNHAEEGAKIWNYVENSAYYADYYGKFHLEESQNQGRKKCHYKAVYKSTFDKGSYYGINLTHSFADNAVMLLT